MVFSKGLNIKTLPKIVKNHSFSRNNVDKLFLVMLLASNFYYLCDSNKNVFITICPWQT